MESTTSSAKAKKKWERLNNITTTIDLNSLDNGSCQQNDPVYLKRVIMSDVALLKMVKHTSTNSCISLRELLGLEKDRKELMGLFKGWVSGDAITGGLGDVVGWYRTSTTGGFPTETDISTQMRIQKFKGSSFAIVIDGGTTRYPLLVTYFKSSLGSDDAWENFWKHLISTPKTPGKTIDLEVSDENKENLEGLLEYYVVKREFTKQYSSPTEATIGLYVKLVKDVGSSESGSNISSPQKSFFHATLTQDQAMKLADHECVAAIGALPRNCYSEMNFA
ncbi:hypothetical protein KSS87_007939 [Heliosperma pusillum]|nr:hypothetical protein KSS87_007939 [Heliosperma pusillum]